MLRFQALLALTVLLAAESSAQCPVADPAFGPIANGGQGFNFASYGATGHLGSLVAVGEMTSAGGVPVSRAAMFDGVQWTGLNGPQQLPGYPQVVRSLDLGSGAELLLGSHNNSPNANVRAPVYRWTGAQWSPLATTAWGVGVDTAANDMALFDEGSGARLFVAGHGLGSTVLTYPLQAILRWDGAAWTWLGSGVTGTANALAVHDDGSGSKLFLATDASVLAWDGANWSDTGYGNDAYSLASYDDGSGALLYSTGLGGFRRWDGATWQAVPGALPGMNGPLAVFDDRSGAGPRLWIASNFGLRAFDGTSWTTWPMPDSGGFFRLDVASGLGGGDALVISGYVNSVDGVASKNIGVVRGCAEAVSFCAGDGTGVVACPCANSGLAGRGCDNASATGGALLTANGATQPDTLVLSAIGARPTALCIFVQGSSELAQPAVFGDGLRCVGGSLLRLYTKNAVAGATSAPAAGDVGIRQRAANLAQPIALGTTRTYQLYYRDVSATFCPEPTGGFANLSNALRVTW